MRANCRHKGRRYGTRTYRAFRSNVRVIKSSKNRNIRNSHRSVAMSICNVMYLLRLSSRIFRWFRVRVVNILGSIFRPSCRRFVTASKDIRMSRHLLRLRRLRRVFITSTFLRLFFNNNRVIICLFRVLRRPSNKEMSSSRGRVRFVISSCILPTNILGRIQCRLHIIVTSEGSSSIVNSGTSKRDSRQRTTLITLRQSTRSNRRPIIFYFHA